METTIEELERKRREILDGIAKIGDMRKGSISIVYRQCNKKQCACKKKGHPGHGPYFYWTYKKDGITITRQFKPGAQLSKLQAEIDNYKEFKKLAGQLIEANDKLCDLRPVEISREIETDAKKNSARSSRRNLKRK